MTKNSNSKKTFWDYWSTSHLVFGALATLITAITGLFAAGIIKAPKFSQQKESPVVGIPKNSDQTQTSEIPSVETPKNSVEVKGYKAVLESCNRAGESVTCDVLITSTEKNSNVTLYAQFVSRFSRIIDSNGEQYKANLIKYGGEENNYLRVDFIQGVRQRVKVSFAKVPLQVNKLGVLEVIADSFNLKFRDFVISNNQ